MMMMLKVQRYNLRVVFDLNAKLRCEQNRVRTPLVRWEEKANEADGKHSIAN